MQMKACTLERDKATVEGVAERERQELMKKKKKMQRENSLNIL